MEPISVHFKLSEQEYMAGARLLTSADAAAKARAAASITLYAVGVLFLLLAFDAALMPSLLAGTSVLVTLIFALHRARLRLTRRCFRGDHRLRHGLTLTFTDDYVQLQGPEYDSKQGWKLYTDVREGRDSYVLVYGKDIRMMTIVPKRAFKNEQQERAFRGLLARHFDRQLGVEQRGEIKTAEDDYRPSSLQPPDWR